MDTDSNPSSGFDFNQPTIIALLYLSSFLVGITALIGLILAYVWQSEAKDSWEASHFQFHIRTFWFGLLGAVISAILILVLIGFLGFLAVGIWMLVRTIIALLAAQKRQALANPKTLLW